MNTKATIKTIDLPKITPGGNAFKEELILSDGNYNDDFLRSEQMKKVNLFRFSE